MISIYDPEGRNRLLRRVQSGSSLTPPFLDSYLDWGLDRPVLSGTDFSYFFGAYRQSGREDGNDPFCPPHQVTLLVSIALPLIIPPDTEDAHVLRIRQHIEGMLACSRAAAGDPWSICT